MQTYELDSPQACACIVALALVADGDIGREELQWLESVQAHEQLEMSRDEMLVVMSEFCADLMQEAPEKWPPTGPLDEREIARLMDRITQPDLRQRVLHLCVQLVEADGHVAEAESIVLNAAVEHWGLQWQMMQPLNEWPMSRAA